MFESRIWKESTELKVSIPDFPHSIVEIVYYFFYDHEIIHQINDSNALELLQFADKYDINGLKVSFNLWDSRAFWDRI